MSTRGTYLLPASEWTDQLICFYAQSDNYPQGAAYYFWQMHHYKNTRGGYAGKFFRANDNAEFTSCHDDHGDTEYRYNLDADGNLTVWHQAFDSDDWKVIYEGSWYVFVNEQLPDEENLYLFKITSSDFLDKSDFVMTLTEAKAHINSQMEIAKMALDKGLLDNASSAVDEAKLCQDQVNAILQSMPQLKQMEAT